jgi:hypothetical protein
MIAAGGRIPASELAETVEKGYFSLHRVYKVVFKEEDMVRSRGNASFDLNDYYRTPEKYYPVTEKYLPYLNVLINAIFWRPDILSSSQKVFGKSLWREHSTQAAGHR